DEKNLVAYAINGLGDKYEQVARIIHHRETPPTFAQTQSMLLLEESRLIRKSTRQSARDPTSSSPHMLLAAASNNRNNSAGVALCRNFQRSSCSFGERCKYVHTNVSGSVTQNGNGNTNNRGSSPQWNNTTGRIVHGTRMTFSHTRPIKMVYAPQLGSLDPPPAPLILVGSLPYLTFTHADLSYAVQQVCLYMHDPREPYLSAMKHILRYVRGTLDHGLQLYIFPTSQLIAYSDADWAGCPNTLRSISGYCVFLGDNLITWSSKCQHLTSCSSAEAEYRGVANAVAETAWVRNLLRELLVPLRIATLVYYDNISAVYLSCNPVQHQRTKHVEIDIYFVRDFVATDHVRVLHVSSRYQFADIFTKGLPSPLFAEFRFSLSVRPPPAPTARAYWCIDVLY
nr:ribonuclease H-like domain-containing protein [Tanacetum cinerariifolium]